MSQNHNETDFEHENIEPQPSDPQAEAGAEADIPEQAEFAPDERPTASEESADIAEQSGDVSEEELFALEEAPGWELLVESVQGAEEPDDPVVQLVHEYKDAIRARDEWEDKYLRAAAEFANAKRRAQLRAENEVWSAQERVLSQMLPVLDDMERAFTAIPEDSRESTWAEGMTLIRRKLLGVLEREGVTLIEAEGKQFDPNLHQAVVMEEVEDAESGSILEVFQQGYMLGDRVLRPSMVKVAQ